MCALRVRRSLAVSGHRGAGFSLISDFYGPTLHSNFYVSLPLSARTNDSELSV